MKNDSINQRYRFIFVMILTLAVMAGFLLIIKRFLLDILLAAIFGGILHPIYRRALKRFGGRRAFSAGLVVGITAIAIALPLLGATALVGTEAVEISKDVVVWAQGAVSHPTQIQAVIPSWLMPEDWVQRGIVILESRIGDVIRIVSGFLSSSVSSVTQGAIDLFLDLFVVLFGIFYFLHDGKKLVNGLIERIPLGRIEAQALVEKSLLITSATLKSIVAVGIAQGTLVGIAFTVTGIGKPWFWGAVVAVSSIVPALGAPVVYFPAAIYLALSGKIAAGIGVALWGMLIVGSIDNLLRMYIVGRGAALPDFVVFVSTVGGLIVLGLPGILIGPILAGMLLGVLDLYQRVLDSSGITNEPPDPPEQETAAAELRPLQVK
jgi:predicted PurR-regulated permease PerM